MGRKITVVEKFYVQEHMDTLESKDIAKALGWSVSQVEKTVAWLRKNKQERAGVPEQSKSLPPPPPETSPPEPVVAVEAALVPSLNQLARRPGRMAAATTASTEAMDELAKEHSSKSPFRNMMEYIHRPFGDTQETK